MTGSGKTGLCLGLIEEAAIDGVPVIAIDPKGDLGNLLLTFPSLSPEDFRPWIDEDEARRAGRTPDDQAAAEAERWKKGLAEWGQDGARIERLRRAAEFAIYTPGSRAGRRCRSSRLWPRLRRPRSPTASSCRNELATPPRACSRSPASTPRPGAASTRFSPPSSRRPGGRATISTSAALIQQIQTPPFPEGRGRRSRVVLSQRRSDSTLR